MTQNDPEPLTEAELAIVECIRILARRGRELREAAEKQVVEQARSEAENNSDPMVNTPSSKE